jgi:hypothetical protein
MADRVLEFLATVEGLNGVVPLETFVKSIHISLRFGYIYVETPKVACTTITSLLISAELDRLVEFTHHGYVHLREYSPLLTPAQVGNLRDLITDGFFVFCFSRDPYARLLSAYLDKIVGRAAPAHAIALQLGRPLHKPYDISFAEFVHAVDEQPISMMDLHWRPQYHQTFHPGLKYSYYGRFDSLEADVQHVCRTIGIDYEKFYRPERRHAADADSKLQQYYTPELRQIVARKYKVDFDYFGYPV